MDSDGQAGSFGGADLLARVRAARRRLAESGPPSTRPIEGDFERVSLPAHDGDLLRELLVGEAAATVIEIGLAYGSSTLAIGEALAANAPPYARHLVIDPHQRSAFGNAGWDTVRQAGLDTICTLMEERSQTALPRLAAEGLVVDAAFVDGSHHFHNVFVDLFFLRQIVRPQGMVILDDCNWPSVATAVRYYEVNLGWQQLTDTTGHDHSLDERATRIRAFRLPGRRSEPPFDAFKPFS